MIQNTTDTAEKYQRPTVDLSNAELQNAMHEITQRLAGDYLRPSWHLSPTAGRWWDINGTFYHRGRYHVMFIRRLPAEERKSGFAANWGHASSIDLLHWVFHRDSFSSEIFSDGERKHIISGDAVDFAPVPTLLACLPGEDGIIAAQPADDELETWALVQDEPIVFESEKVRAFDPTGWYDTEKEMYYMLAGNKSKHPGYTEGDGMALLSSKDLKEWQYIGPLYKSSREFTLKWEDTACPDFFPLEDKYVLLAHVHAPWTHCRYYVGTFDGTTFVPESVGRIGYISDQICAPETLVDGRGRRIFFGQIRTRSLESGLWEGTSFSLPMVLTLGADKKSLHFAPAEELKQLRYDPVRGGKTTLTGKELPLPQVSGHSLEIQVSFSKIEAKRAGIVLAASEDREEYTTIAYLPEEKVIEIDVAHSDLKKRQQYFRYHPRVMNPKMPMGGHMVEENPSVTVQRVPFSIAEGEPLELQVFYDGCIIEVIANGRAYTAQVVYPSRRDLNGTALFVEKGTATVEMYEAYRLHRTLAY